MNCIFDYGGLKAKQEISYLVNMISLILMRLKNAITEYLT